MTAARPAIRTHLVALARAAAAGRRALITYRDAEGAVSRREVDVLSLGWRWGRWVLLAHCHRRAALRVFLLERIEAARVGRRRAQAAPPEGVDPAEFALADLQAPDAGPARRVALDLPRALAGLAPALFAGAAVEAGPDGPRVHLRATDLGALSEMATSLGVALG